MLWAYNIRVLAILAVIVLHASAGFIAGVGDIDPFYGSKDWWMANVYDSITRWCVPVFVMISGYFLLNNSDSTDVFFKKRFIRVFPPLVFWSIIYCIWTVLKFTIKGDLDLAFSTIFNGILHGKPYYHLWFLFMLPFLYLVTPFLKNLLYLCEKKYLAFLIFFLFFMAIVNVFLSNLNNSFSLASNDSLFINDFLYYLGYFTLGGYINKYKVAVRVLPILAGLLLAWGVTASGSYIFTYKYFYNYLSVNTVLASVCMFFLIMRFCDFDFMKSSRMLSSTTFGIYLIHPIFLEAFSYLFEDKLLNIIDISIYIPVVSLFVFFVSFCSIFIIDKIGPLKKFI